MGETPCPLCAQPGARGWHGRILTAMHNHRHGMMPGTGGEAQQIMRGPTSQAPCHVPMHHPLSPLHVSSFVPVHHPQCWSVAETRCPRLGNSSQCSSMAPHGACLSSERSKRGRCSGGYRGFSGLNRSGCSSTCVFIRPLSLMYLMFHPPPSQWQYSYGYRVELGWTRVRVGGDNKWSD